VTTISAGKEVTEKAKIKGYYPAIIVPKALDIGPKIQGTFGKAYKAGGGIAVGKNAGVFKKGEKEKEVGFMVEARMNGNGNNTVCNNNQCKNLKHVNRNRSDSKRIHCRYYCSK